MPFRAPLYVVWEITRNCNARCVHCYSDAAFGSGRTDSWSREACLELIDQLAEAGVFILAFSGGEIFMRPDWAEIVGYAVRQGLRVSLATNGIKVTPKTARKLAELGVANVSVSLDGGTAEIHEAVRQTPGIFKAACQAIRNLKEAGVTVTANFTPMSINYLDAEPVVRLAHELKADKVNLTEYVYLSRGGLELMLSPEQLQGVIQQWLALAKTYAGKIELNWHDCRVALLVDESEREKYSGCGAGYTHCRITEDKSVTPCVVMPTPVGSLTEQTFMEIWRGTEALNRIRSRDSISEGNCSVCEHKVECGGCRASSYAFYGHPYGGDPMCWIKPELAREVIG